MLYEVITPDIVIVFQNHLVAARHKGAIEHRELSESRHYRLDNKDKRAEFESLFSRLAIQLLAELLELSNISLIEMGHMGNCSYNFV